MARKFSDKYKVVQASSYAVEEAKRFHRGDENTPTLTEQKILENDNTMVTVICITYNHEEYIAQALNSFIMQKTDFKFKVFVGEDCGSDRTAEIVREYAEKYPDLIIPFIREENMGAQRNLIDLCQRATSPYIAFCEGDDYWIDEYKLQKQVDYMEYLKEVRVCFARAEIDAPRDWFLREYFIANKDGRLIYPDCEPNYNLPNRLLSMWDLTWIFPAHTSTLLYRWNYDITIPEWYYTGIVGDWPLMLLQLGDQKAGYIEDIVSVYRRSSVGIYMSSSMDEHFLRTRLDHLRWMEGIIDYYKNGIFKKAPIISFENRIKHETANYLRVALKQDNANELIMKLFTQYPTSGKIALSAYLSFYNDSRLLTNCYTWEGYKLLVRNKWNRNLIKPIVKAMIFKNRYKAKISTYKTKLKKLMSIICYWVFTLVPKKKNLWIFSGFKKTSYMDNSRHLYEYVLNNHPEIESVWVTNSQEIFDRLSTEGKPVRKMRTLSGIWSIARANIAFSDHFKMSDYENYSGYNNRIKLVQLWHGVGIKSMKNFQLTTVPGVQFSNDIIVQKSDTLVKRLKKYLLYLRKAPHRELMERYFMFLCPGRDSYIQWKESYNLKDNQIFICGYPRTATLMENAQREKPKVNRILYAPTYRWSSAKEKEMIDNMLEAMPKIQEYMERIDGEMVIRLHPHTWRDYAKIIKKRIESMNRIKIDTSDDVYDTLHTYTMLITDYSSIAYDFLLLDRPLIFLCYDYEDFISHENLLRHDYIAYSPGEKVMSWEDIPSAIQMYLDNPKKDVNFRAKIRNEFFEDSVNTVDSSEILIREIKKRINLNI